MDTRQIGFIIHETPTQTHEMNIVSENPDRLIAEGILQDLEVDNRNGRFYEIPEIKPEIEGSRIRELIKTGNMKGETGHPMVQDLARQQTIDPDMVCVKYLDIWLSGNDVKARFCGTNNDKGDYFDKDLRCGELPSFSLRALGTIVSKKGRNYVRNCKIVTFDRVYYPSHQRAYTERILTGDENTKNNKTVYEQTDMGLLIPITNGDVINYIKSESANIKSILESFDTLYNQISLVENGTQVQLIGRDGSIFRVYLETYIQDEIYRYVENK